MSDVPDAKTANELYSFGFFQGREYEALDSLEAMRTVGRFEEYQREMVAAFEQHMAAERDSLRARIAELEATENKFSRLMHEVMDERDSLKARVAELEAKLVAQRTAAKESHREACAQAVLAEREACAKVVEKSGLDVVSGAIARLIRARGGR